MPFIIVKYARQSSILASLYLLFSEVSVSRWYFICCGSRQNHSLELPSGLVWRRKSCRFGYVNAFLEL